MRRMRGAVSHIALPCAIAAGILAASGCSGTAGFAGSSAKYYEAAGFAAMDGPAQVAELESEGFGYFDTEGGWCWGGTPSDNPCAGPAWVSFESRGDPDGDGFPAMTREALEAGGAISGYEASWADVPCPVSETEARAAEIAAEFGLRGAVAQGWSSDKSRYTMAGGCAVAGSDGLWTVELSPSPTGADFCSVRLSAKTLDGAELETAASSAVDAQSVSPESDSENGQSPEQ